MLRLFTLLKPLTALLALALGACDRPAPARTESAGTSPATFTGAAAPMPAGVRTFVIVPDESRAAYLADEELFAQAFTKFGLPAGWAKVVGNTRAISGRFQMDTGRPDTWLGDNEFSVRMNTFSTDREMRDNWIRENGPRFNDYPEARFKATAIATLDVSSGERKGSARPGEALSFNLHGDLTIRDITRPATFAVKATLDADTLHGSATTRLRMSDFGIETISFFETLTVADEIGLEVQFTARADSSATNDRH